MICDFRWIIVIWAMAMTSPILVLLLFVSWRKIDLMEKQINALLDEKIIRARQFAEHRGEVK